MIHVEHLSKQYGSVKAVSDLNFTVETGQILGFLGPNGAGKTTTMRILCGIFPPTSGKAVVAGFNVTENPLEIRKRIGYLPEQVPLYPELRVRQYLNFVASIWNFSKTERSRRLDEVIQACGLMEVDDALMGRLSRGYRQRVGLAQALVHDPEVLILDEPTVGLDPKQIHEIRELIKSLKRNKTVILSTHILPEVSMTCDKVIIINEGKVAAEGTPETLLRSMTQNALVEIEVGAPAGEVSKILSCLPKVSAAKVLPSPAPGRARLAVESKPGHDVRPELARAIAQKNWELFEMRLQSFTLEDVFLKLVTREEPA